VASMVTTVDSPSPPMKRFPDEGIETHRTPCRRAGPSGPPMKRFPDEGIETRLPLTGKRLGFCAPMKRFPDEGIETFSMASSFCCIFSPR